MKILYNVTVKIDTALNTEWLEWMKSVHIPDIMATSCFESYRIARIIGDDDEHGVGFAIQYIAPDMDTFQRYQSNFAKKLQTDHSDRYKNHYVAFRTLMQIEEEGNWS
ncbi:MAG: DUF4286 family protein [Saprospiraceae bacterium]|nr:DUF4286 family protein [Saprospiraceae bacterium]